MIAINIWAALVLIVLIIVLALLIGDRMSQKHEYRMARLEQDHEVAMSSDGDNR